MANVPAVAGVPALLTGTTAPQSTPQALLDDVLQNLPTQQQSPQWGLFRNGQMVISADTVVSFDYKQEWVLADFPLEQGAFETYDKVATPYDIRIRFIAGVKNAARTNLLRSVAAVSGDYLLYDAVTPEAVYRSCNVRHYDYRRTSTAGRGIIVVDLWLMEVRLGPQGNLVNSVFPSGANQFNGGVLQPVPATASQVALATGVVGGGLPLTIGGPATVTLGGIVGGVT